MRGGVGAPNRLAVTLLVAVLGFLVGAAADSAHGRFQVINQSRDSTELFFQGDRLAISCLSCQSLGLTVTGWNTFGSGSATVTSFEGYSAVITAGDAGVVGVEAVAQDGLGNVSHLVFLLQVEPKSVECYLWHGCFTSTIEGDAACQIRWDEYQEKNATLFLRLWVGMGANEWSPVNHSSFISEEDKMLTDELYALGESPIGSVSDDLSVSLSEALLYIEPGTKGMYATYEPSGRFWYLKLKSKYATMDNAYLPGGLGRVMVKGQVVNVMGCTVAASGNFAVDLPKFQLETSVPSAGSGVAELDGAGEILVDVCSSVLMTGSTDAGTFWISQDVMAGALRQPRRWSVPLELFTPGNASDGLQIMSIANSRQSLVLLTQSGMYRVPAALQANSSSVGSGGAEWLGDRPSSSITRIAGVAGCDMLLDYFNKTRNDDIVAWDSNNSGLRSFFFSANGGLTFNELEFDERDLSAERTLILRTLLPLISVPQIAVIARESASGEDQVWLYNPQTKRASLASAFGASQQLPSLADPVGLTTPVVPSGELILWGGDKLYYSPSMGRSWHRIMLKVFSLESGSYELAVLDTANGEHLAEVVASDRGDLAVRTSHGQIFTGTLGLGDAYLVASPFTADAALAKLWFSPGGSTLLAIQAAAGSADLTHDFALQVSPVAMQVKLVTGTPADAGTSAASVMENANLGALRSTFECPYFSWDRTGQTASAFYADMNERIQTSMELVHRAQQPNMNIAFQTSDRKLIEMIPGEEHVESNYDGSVVKRKRQVEIRVPDSISATTGVGSQGDAAGKVVVRSSPTRFSPGCEQPSLSVQVNVGCPRGRHLRYVAPELFAQPSTSVISIECEAEAASYGPGEYERVINECVCQRYMNKPTMSIPREMVDLSRTKNFLGPGNYAENDVDETIDYQYDASVWGCPTYVPYTSSFVPKLQLWDFNTFVKEVDADFTVVEAHGRKEFYFAQSAKAAGCKKRPDSWDEKLRAAGDGAKPEAATWGPHNHNNCLESPTSSNSSAGADPISEWGENAYEILRQGSTGNYITFRSTSVDVPYQFRAVVVDPDYSFCVLETTFAVEVYGMPMSSWETIKIILYVIICSMALLGLTYIMHRKEIMQAQENDEAKKMM